MTTATYTEMKQIAEMAAEYIAGLNSENETFEIENNGYLAVINCKATIEEDGGDYYTAPCWSISELVVNVLEVYNDEGEADNEAARWLNEKLN